MKARRIPLRKCVVCQKMLSKKEMIRVVRTPEGNVELDTTGKKNGRGAYICGKLEGFEKAKKSKSFERALKVTMSSDDYMHLQEQFLTVQARYDAIECEKEKHESKDEITDRSR